MNCKQCAYYWQDDGESFKQCHFNSVGVWDLAPCEYPETDNAPPDKELDHMYDEYMEDKKHEPAHGHWVDVGSLSCRCSECGCKNDRERRFCPNCGAKMDLEDKKNAENHVL